MLRNLLVVIINPRVGWQYIDDSSHSTQRVLAGIFYPLLALLAISAFVPMIYNPAEHTLSQALMTAIIAFSKFLITYFLCSYLLSGFYPQFMRSHVATAKLNNYIVYNLSLLVILSILINLLPETFSPINYLFIYMPYMASRGIDFLGVSSDRAKNNKFIIISTAMMLLLPIIFGWLLNTIIKQ